MKTEELKWWTRFACLWLFSISAALAAFFFDIPLPVIRADAQAQLQDPSVKTLIAGVKNREASVSTAKAMWVKEVYNNQNPVARDVVNSRLQPIQLSHLFWVADGIKVREDEKIIIPDQRYKLAAYNGERVQAWIYGAAKATDYYEEHISEWPLGQSADVLQLPLGKDGQKLRKSQQLENREINFIGKEKIGGVQAYKVEALATPTIASIETWWIAPELGYLIIKHERRLSQPNVNGQITSWRKVELVDKVLKIADGVWIPRAMRHINYVIPKAQDEVWTTLYRITVLSSTANEKVSPEIFDLPLPLGTGVGAAGRDYYYVVGGDVSAFESKARSGQPEGAALLDVPIGNKVEHDNEVKK